MNVYELIRRKRDRGSHSREEVQELISAYTQGDVPDYQMAAWLMAVFFRGMNADETTALTSAMVSSGRVFDLSSVPGPKVDKHSTGGIGDKVSLILAPLAAACGVCVPMVSGRGLGHTGGTLDKLESIPGFRTDFRYEEFIANLRQIGVCIMGQTDELCPADRKLYALRDVTATVDSVPLIAASIMSKKIAEGIDGLVLDVKTGGGAFMTRTSQARTLARTMMRIGAKMGKRVVAVITGMWEPLGEAVGNSLEVVEAIEALKGNWRMDLEEVTMTLAEEMLVLAGRARTYAQARRQAMRALTQGQALEKFRQMIDLQGGNPKVIDDYSLLPRAKHVAQVLARSSGYVRAIDALTVGLLAVEMGAGRLQVGAKIDPAVGFVFKRKTGDRVEPDSVLAEVHAASAEQAEAVVPRLAETITVSRAAPRDGGRVIARITRP
ncbi:MAG: thymidine phosphorylase [candidate division WOR-3 bacterium]